MNMRSKQGKQQLSRKSVQMRDGITDKTGYIWPGQERDLTPSELSFIFI